MSDTIPAAALVSMLKAAVAKIRDNVDLLTQLDSVTGDGDHGTAMSRSIEAVGKAIDEHADAGAKEVLSKAGWGVMSAAGGSTGGIPLCRSASCMGRCIGRSTRANRAETIATARRPHRCRVSRCGT